MQSMVELTTAGSNRVPRDMAEHFQESYSFALYIIKLRGYQDSYEKIIRLCSDKNWQENNEDENVDFDQMGGAPIR